MPVGLLLLCGDNIFGYVWIPLQSDPFSIDLVSLHNCTKSGEYKFGSVCNLTVILCFLKDVPKSVQAFTMNLRIKDPY